MMRVGRIGQRSRGPHVETSGPGKIHLDSLETKLQDQIDLKAAQAALDAHAELPVDTAHPVPDGPMDMNGQRLENLGAPDSATDAIRKTEGDALQDAIDAINNARGAADGIATLNANQKVPSSQIPAVAISSVHVVADIAARDALDVQEGDIAQVADAGAGTPATYMYDGADWFQISVDSEVLSVNGQTGVVELDKADVGLSNLDNIQQAAKTDFDAHEADTTNPHGVTKSQVGLGSVENYAIASQAQAEAGSSNVRYMTPLRAKQAIEALGVQVATGSYTGDGSDPQAVNVGFQPRFLLINGSASSRAAMAWGDPGTTWAINGSTSSASGNIDFTATGFEVSSTQNQSAEEYTWVAYR